MFYLAITARREAKMMNVGEVYTRHFLNKAVTVPFLAAALSAVGAGCSSVFLQNDGFRSKLAEGCPTEERCEALVEEATKRVDSLPGKTPSGTCAVTTQKRTFKRQARCLPPPP